MNLEKALPQPTELPDLRQPMSDGVAANELIQVRFDALTEGLVLRLFDNGRMRLVGAKSGRVFVEALLADPFGVFGAERTLRPIPTSLPTATGDAHIAQRRRERHQRLLHMAAQWLAGTVSDSLVVGRVDGGLGTHYVIKVGSNATVTVADASTGAIEAKTNLTALAAMTSQHSQTNK